MEKLEKLRKDPDFGIKLSEFVVGLTNLRTTKISIPKEPEIGRFKVEFSYNEMDFCFFLICQKFDSSLFLESSKSYLIENTLGKFEVDNNWMELCYQKVKSSYEERVNEKLEQIKKRNFISLQEDIEISVE